MTAPTWPLPNGQYRYLANWLVEHNPDAANQIIDVIDEHTDYEEAAYRIAADGILSISFGLIARLRVDGPSLKIAQGVGGAWAQLALGNEVTADVWINLYQHAAQRLDAAEEAGQDWPATVALRGLVAATYARVDTAVRDILEHAVLAWNREIKDQHQAVMFWATDMVIAHTKSARKEAANE